MLTSIPRRLGWTLAGLLPIGALGAWLHLDTRDTPPPPLTPPEHGLKVYHLGHSLVGPDIPVLLQQMAPVGHRYNVQRGSGTSLKAHWEPDLEIRDFDIANPEGIWRAPKEAIASGNYDAVILTEMVELRDAIKYFEGAKYLQKWVNLASQSSPPPRIYLYETWHPLDDPTGWLSRIDHDLEALWLGRLARRTMRDTTNQPLYLIPGGQALAAVARAGEAGDIPGITSREQLFALKDDGTLDMIHLGDLGHYVIALTHYAVLYHRTPDVTPLELQRFDGDRLAGLNHETAEALQGIVWRVVTSNPFTGLQPTKEAGAK